MQSHDEMMDMGSREDGDDCLRAIQRTQKSHGKKIKETQVRTLLVYLSKTRHRCRARAKTSDRPRRAQKTMARLDYDYDYTPGYRFFACFLVFLLLVSFVLAFLILLGVPLFNGAL